MSNLLVAEPYSPPRRKEQPFCCSSGRRSVAIGAGRSMANFVNKKGTCGREQTWYDGFLVAADCNLSAAME
jgi:hypothetical protein